MEENSTTLAPSSGFSAPAAPAAASEIRLRKNASEKISENESDRLTNSGQVKRHSPGSSGSLEGAGMEARGLLPGGCSRGTCMGRARRGHGGGHDRRATGWSGRRAHSDGFWSRHLHFRQRSRSGGDSDWEGRVLAGTGRPAGGRHPLPIASFEGWVDGRVGHGPRTEFVLGFAAAVRHTEIDANDAARSAQGTATRRPNPRVLRRSRRPPPRARVQRLRRRSSPYERFRKFLSRMRRKRDRSPYSWRLVAAGARQWK